MVELCRSVDAIPFEPSLIYENQYLTVGFAILLHFPVLMLLYQLNRWNLQILEDHWTNTSTWIRIFSACVFGGGLITLTCRLAYWEVLSALVILIYSFMLLLYSLARPIYATINENGLLHYFPEKLQHMILQETPMEALQKTAFLENIRRLYPFFFDLNDTERRKAIAQFSPSLRNSLYQESILNSFPSPVKSLLLPKPKQPPYPIEGLIGIKRDGSLIFEPVTGDCGFTFDTATDTQEQDMPIMSRSMSSDVLVSETTVGNRRQDLSLVQMIIMRRFLRTLRQSAAEIPPKTLLTVGFLSTAIASHQFFRGPKTLRSDILRQLRLGSVACAGFVGAACFGLSLYQLHSDPSHRRTFLMLRNKIHLYLRSVLTSRRTLQSESHPMEALGRNSMKASTCAFTMLMVLLAYRRRLREHP